MSNERTSAFEISKSAVGVSPIGEGVFALTASVSSNSVNVQYHKAFCVAAVFAGSSAPTAALSVSGSLDGVNFFGLPNATAVTANGVYALNYDSYAVKYVKANVVRTSAAANATVDLKLCVI